MKYTSKSLFKNIKYLSSEINTKLNTEMLEYITCKIEELLVEIVNDAKTMVYKHKRKIIREDDIIKIIRYRGLPFDIKSEINDNNE